MKIEPSFTKIDTATWPMAQSFYYYTQMAPTSYSVTVNIDVTKTRKLLKENGYKFFPAYLWLTTRAISHQQALKVGLHENELGEWNVLTPAYPQFHEDDHSTSLLWTQYEDNFKDFHQAYLKDTSTYGKDHGILTSKGVPLPNAYIISCIPWFSFSSFCLHNHGIKDYYVPSFEAGAFFQQGDATMMPLSITVHHATTDGYHLKVFFEELQESMNHPETWM